MRRSFSASSFGGGRAACSARTLAIAAATGAIRMRVSGETSAGAAMIWAATPWARSTALNTKNPPAAHAYQKLRREWGASDP